MLSSIKVRLYLVLLIITFQTLFPLSLEPISIYVPLIAAKDTIKSLIAFFPVDYFLSIIVSVLSLI